MAGTVTVGEQRFSSVRKVTFTWVSSAGGAADAVTTYPVDGDLLAVYQVPDGGGTQPTNLYDVVVTDGDGIDVLNGLGANLSNAANTIKRTSDGLLPVAASLLTLAVTNAGNAKGGQTILYIR